ncbi:hypothetical protein [Rhodoplanes sp. SY1]|uniref:hypothetical protein n=1 Tax=Rhodoplanes sp. SY1 TaxID=3166646 RepID=UPI0038B47A68
MTANDIFADESAVEADLFLQESILWSRSVLSARLVEASVARKPELLDTLRIEAMYQFCEFFYLLRARRIESEEEIARLADIHNQHLDTLLRDADKMKRLGLRKDRVLDAIFTADTLPRLVETWRGRAGRIDQSNLARFLVSVMSTETCRKLVVASAEAGFLERGRSPFGTILVSSTGVMEQVFGGVLRDLRRRLAAIVSDTVSGGVQR